MKNSLVDEKRSIMNVKKCIYKDFLKQPHDSQMSIKI